MKKLFAFFLIVFYISNYNAQTISVSSTQGLINAKQSLNGGSGSATVELANGIYFLSDTLVFTEADGRSGTDYITYKAASGAKPIISGGYLVTGTWQQVSGENYYKVSIPTGAGTEGLEYVRNLYVDGKRARRARSSAKEIVGAHKDSNGNYDGITISKDQIPEFSKPEYVEMQQLVRWKDHYYKIETMQTGGILNYGLIIKNYDWAHTQSFSFAPEYYDPNLVHERGVLENWYFENAIELLDEPGEWYFDVPARELYYYPLSTEDVNSSTVIMPRLNRLIDIKSSGVGSKVKNLRFEGITFSHTNWDFPSKEGFLTLQGTIISNGLNSLGADNGVVPRTKIHVDAAVQVDGGENLVFEKNTFTHIGNNGINIHNNTNNVDILRNTFIDISANAMRISNVFNQTIDAGQGEAVVSHTLVKNNYIEKIGREFRGSIGIEYMYTDNIEVLHNEIRDVPYIGISAGIGWEGVFSDNSTTMTDAEVSYNKIVGAMNIAKEGGSIYTNNRHNSSVSGEYGLVIRENYVDEVSFPFTTQTNDRQAPIHNDEGSANTLIIKNVLETVRTNFEWAHKVCEIDIDSTFVASGKTTNIIGNPRRCTTDVQVTNTISLPNPEADSIKFNSGIEKDQEPPGYPLYTNNLAYKKPAFASSFFNNDLTKRAYSGVDGDRNSIWRCAVGDEFPWWYVDLGDFYQIKEVLLVDRHDFDTPITRENFVIEGADNPEFSNAIILHEQVGVPFSYKSVLKVYSEETEELRYIRVRKTVGNQNFSIGELRVYGNKKNLALEAGSSTLNQWPVNSDRIRANDGDLMTGWQSGSVTNAPYITFDLGGIYKIDEINFITRQDPLYDQPVTRRNFKIISSDDFNFQNNVQDIHVQGSTSIPHLGSVLIDVPDGIETQYITVLKTVANEHLYIAEIEIFGESVSSPVNHALEKSLSFQSEDLGNEAINATDNTIDTFWKTSSSSASNYISVDLEDYFFIHNIQLFGVMDIGSDLEEYRKNFVIEGSNKRDFSSGVTVLHTQGTTPFDEYGMLYAEVAGNAATKRYRYLRVRKTVNENMAFSEIRIFGSNDHLSNNLALNKPTVTSTSYTNSSGETFEGSYTNDNSIGNGWASADNNYPYWSVDLGASYSISEIEFVTRQNSAIDIPSQRNNFVVESSPNADFSNSTTLLTIGSSGLNHLGIRRTDVSNVVGQYVRVRKTAMESFYIAEFRVYGLEEGSTNLALNKTATQSTTAFSGVASRAVDGNTNGQYTNNSVTHTNGSGTNEYHWWQVDLGQQAEIDQVRVYNRVDPNTTNKLDNIYVFVSGNPFSSNDVAQTLSQPGVDSFLIKKGNTINSIDMSGTSGRFIRVQKKELASSALSLAEVEVYGVFIGSNKSAVKKKEEQLDVEEETLEGIVFYPNPVGDLLNIKMKTSIKTVHIYNLVGMQVLSKAYTSNVNKESLDVTGLSSGIYIIRAIDYSGNLFSNKFIKK